MKSVTSCIKGDFETGLYTFLHCDKATFYVPKGLDDAYKSTFDWFRISNIVEVSNQYDENNDGATDISDVVTHVNAILSSSEKDDSYDVNGDGNVDISDVVKLVIFILGQ